MAVRACSMTFRLFRRSDNQAVIAGLYAATVAAARQPALFTELGMVDTFEGRFESVTLHAALVLRRLNALPTPGPEVAQDLVDAIFRHFDHTLRESGVGDTVVPKRMKRLVEAFLGRSTAYDEALRRGDGLQEALARNVLAVAAGERPSALRLLTRYVEEAATLLDAVALQVFLEARPPFPDASIVAGQA